MALTLILAAVGLALFGALLSLALIRSSRAALLAGSTVAGLACATGLAGALLALLTGEGGSLELPWQVPLGVLHLGLDALSAFFLLGVFLVGGLATLYGVGHFGRVLAAMPEGERAHRLGIPLSLYNLLLASMAAILLARDGVLFLVTWELMSVSSFFLVTHEDGRDEVRRAGMTYLIASHLGLIFLFLFFGLLSLRTDGFDFAQFLQAGAPAASFANLAFLMALAGFGTKAAFWPAHVWAPDAYPAAPSHVAGLMSGAMSKLGIYGLLRALEFLGPPPAWWGALLVALGIASGLAGILHALAQQDLKRLVAYSSIENLGIVAIGLGIGLLGRAHGQPAVAFLGFGGALMHVLNHGLLKGLLFQASGSVLHGAGTRAIDSLGGLYRTMPVTGLVFLVGAVGLSGLPPLNAFTGEWMIYFGAFQGSFGLPAASAVFALFALAGLGLIGGLAAAAFVKAFGIVFLGAPRSGVVETAKETGGTRRVAMLLGAGLCLLLGVLPRLGLTLAAGPAGALAGVADPGAIALGPIDALTRVAIILGLLIAGVAAVRWRLLRGREVRVAPTWGCGYTEPTARMQYTGSSFAQLPMMPFARLLPQHARVERPVGWFPSRAHVEERLGDLAGERILVPAARRLVDALGRVRVIQHGRLHLYLVYVLVTLLALLAWQLAS